MITAKESELFNKAFADPFLYICKSNFKYCIVHFASKCPFQIRTLDSCEHLDEIIQRMTIHAKRLGVPFVKDTIYE